MKFFLITILGALLSTNPDTAQASSPAPTSSPKEDWTEIRNDRDVVIAQPDIAEVTGGIFNTCITDNELRSIQPVEQCSEYKIIETAPSSGEFGEAEFHCLQKVTVPVAVSRQINKTECSESVRFQNENENGSCLTVKEDNSLPETITLGVLKNRGEQRGHTLFVKDYQIPRC